MIDHDSPRRAEIDERWFTEWIEAGLPALDAYLRNYARFEAYLEHREAKP